MSKIVSLVVTVILLNVAMFVFTFTGTCPDGGCNVEDYNTEANSTMWEYFTNPQVQSGSSFWTKLFSTTEGILGLLAAGGALVAVGLFVTKDINVAYISIMVFLVGATIGTWVRLFVLINNSSFILGGRSGGVVAMVVVSTLLAVQLFNALDWGRGVS